MIVVISITHISCKSDSSPKLKKEQSKKIQADYFPIPNNKFEEYKSNSVKWFRTANNNSKLYLVPYTDYSITTAILTSNKLVSSDIISLLKSERIPINDFQNAIIIDSIVSKRGIRIGNSPKDLLQIFGAPKTRNHSESQLTLGWSFNMLATETDDQVGGLRPFIINDLGFEVKAIFESDKLTTVIYKYQIP